LVDVLDLGPLGLDSLVERDQAIVDPGNASDSDDDDQNENAENGRSSGDKRSSLRWCAIFHAAILL
jgi:hypothetical protein